LSLPSARLPGGRLELLYGRADHQHITYASFGLK
jgi:hypothetical protein